MPLATIKHAFRTAYEEVAEFRFDYPLKLVPEAGPKTALHYYVYLDRKNPPARSVLRLDSNGVACVRQRQTSKLLYRPGFIAMYGLGSLHEFLQTGEDASLKAFWIKSTGSSATRSFAPMEPWCGLTTLISSTGQPH